VKSLVERLRREREAEMDKSRASPLGSWSTRAREKAEKAQRKYLSTAISSSIASERQAASTLPASLQLNGESALSVSDAAQIPGARSAQSWRMNLDVPVTHFWGRATLSAGFERSEAGAARDAETASAPLQQNATVSLRQDIQKGALSGTAQVALSGNDSRQNALPTEGERDRNAKAEGSARLKLQLRPGLSITGAHQSQLERAASLQPSAAGAAVEPQPEAGSGASSDVLARLGERQGGRWDVERQAGRRSNSELGLEWKWSKSLALTAGASSARSGQQAAQTSAAGESQGAGVWVPRWLRDESRANLSLQRRTGGGSWGLNWSRAWAQQDAASQEALQRAEDKRSDALSLQAERKVFGWLSMRGSWKLAGETNYLAARLSDQATREAEARISGGLGSLALRYSDWSSQSSAASGALDGSGKREYGVRYEAGHDSGLGLGIEYSVRDEKASAASSNWKLGVTYR